MHLQNKDSRIYVAGHSGLVGSAIVRKLEADGYTNLLTRSSDKLDLRNQGAVDRFFHSEKPEFVVLAAARVGGILANSQAPVPFLEDNLSIELNVIRASYESRVSRLIFLGSSCVYPKLAPQPLKEEFLLTGPLEETNEWYAIAKIAGIKLCEAYRKQHDADFISLMPTNLYGPGDNFDLQSSHVLPALIRKFHESKSGDGNESVVLWGTGQPRREFLFIDDLADACLFVLTKPEEEIERNSANGLLNVGTGSDLTIEELATIIQDAVGSSAAVTFDTSKPDGTPRKLMDVSRMKSMGWEAKTGLKAGIQNTYEWYREHERVDSE
ncbi:MAG: GDP-L-fucose synthase [Rhodothermia bacterium]|nr:MAG: GDP-L-fucose synthase [Rhodothermia bacterium]